MREADAAMASKMPDLKTEDSVTHTTKEKSKVLLETFFPLPLQGDLSDTEDYQYLLTIDTSPILKTKTLTVIKNLSSYKAPEPNTIPNIAIQQTTTYILGISKKVFH